MLGYSSCNYYSCCYIVVAMLFQLQLLFMLLYCCCHVIPVAIIIHVIILFTLPYCSCRNIVYVVMLFMLLCYSCCCIIYDTILFMLCCCSRYCCFHNSRATTYVDQMSAWYDVKTKAEIINIKVFEKLEVNCVS